MRKEQFCFKYFSVFCLFRTGRTTELRRAGHRVAFSSLFAVDIGESTILFGTFLTALVTFIAVAFAVFFFVIKPFQAYQARKGVVEEEEGPSEDTVLLQEIRDALKR